MKTLIFLLMFSPTCLASQLEQDYARFYSHLQKIDKQELNALQFAFGFKHVGLPSLCHIQQASIVTQKVTIPLTVNEQQRFTLPTEKALKLADATVSLTLTEASNLCDLSVQLETKPGYVKQQYSLAELKMLSAQFKQFFADMGSFLAFMMPGSQGVKIVFERPPLWKNSAKGILLRGNELQISDEWLNQSSEGLEFAEKPLRVTAWVE